MAQRIAQDQVHVSCAHGPRCARQKPQLLERALDQGRDIALAVAEAGDPVGP